MSSKDDCGATAASRTGSSDVDPMCSCALVVEGAGAVGVASVGVTRGGGTKVPLGWLLPVATTGFAAASESAFASSSESLSSTITTFLKPEAATGDSAPHPSAVAGGVEVGGAASSASSSLPLTSSICTLRKPWPCVAGTPSSLSLSLSSSIVTRVKLAFGCNATSSSSSSMWHVEFAAGTAVIGRGGSVRSFLRATMRSPLICVLPGDSASAAWKLRTASS
mmetsp:Transcript_29820/g.81830  ORF Transcript_29820/g.81830 Transcript_29820/m.81830 type:complete len:222 (+) Transcript_29820:100-765(+)